VLISVHIIQFHRTVRLSICTCLRFVIRSGGMWQSSHSLMEYRESMFPSIHRSGNIDPNNKFITMCNPLFLTHVGFYRSDLLVSHYHVQEHSTKICRWPRWWMGFDTFYEIQNFLTFSVPSFLSNIFFVDCISLYPIWRSTFVLISFLWPDLQSLTFGARFQGIAFIIFSPPPLWLRDYCHLNNVILLSEHKLWGFSSLKFILLLLPITWTQNW